MSHRERPTTSRVLSLATRPLDGAGLPARGPWTAAGGHADALLAEALPVPPGRGCCVIVSPTQSLFQSLFRFLGNTLKIIYLFPLIF